MKRKIIESLSSELKNNFSQAELQYLLKEVFNIEEIYINLNNKKR